MPSTPPWTLHPVYADGAAGADVGYLYSKGRAAVHGVHVVAPRAAPGPSLAVAVLV